MRFTSFSIYSLILHMATVKKNCEQLTDKEISEAFQLSIEHIRRIVHYLILNGYFENSSDSLLLLSDGNIKDCNNTRSLLSRENSEKPIARSPLDYSSEYLISDIKSFEGVEENIGEAFKDGSFRLEWEHVRMDGTVFWAILTATTLSLDGKDVVIASFRDISDRKQVLKNIQNADATLSKILSIAPDAIISTDKDLHIQMFNKGAENIFGYSSEEVLDRSINILIPERYHQSHGAHVMSFLRKDEDSILMNARREIYGLKKDGTEFPAEASVSTFKKGQDSILAIILRDVSIRKQYENEIIIAKEKALYADKVKTEFLANMSHELRTPLNAILGFSEMMKNHTFGKLGDIHYEEYVNDIYQSGSHLLSIINDILDLSRIESEEKRVNAEELEIKSVVRDCIHLIEHRFKSAELTINSFIPEDIPSLLADKRMLKQMLINLLSNAIKFIEGAGEVKVEVKLHKDGRIIFSVIDNGIGIAKKDIPRVLAPFNQVDSALDRKFEGTGLGLPLVKAMVELHGGQLILESEINVGTKASLIFPKERSIHLKELNKKVKLAAI